MDLLICPQTKQPLHLTPDGAAWRTTDERFSYPVRQNVVAFLGQSDEFYEGTYRSRTYFRPKPGNPLSKLILWMINGGYMWEVAHAFPPGATLLELGCASGVDYFGQQFKMIGLDLSLRSLQGLQGYTLAVQSNAANIPLADGSVDGVLSSYFWEHVAPPDRDALLQEFRRVLKPGGKIVFIYDLETANGLLELLKKRDLPRYRQLFLEGDAHVGYETPDTNRERFTRAGFQLLKHFGMERSWLQSNSVYEKLRRVQGLPGLIGQVCYFFTSSRLLSRPHIFLVRAFDETLGRLWAERKARIIITVAQKTG